MNTTVHYMFRDASNYKNHAEVTLKGSISSEKLKEFNEQYAQHEFYPEVLGFPDVSFKAQGWAEYDDDPDSHEFGYLEASKYGSPVEMTVDEFIAAFTSGRAFVPAYV